MDYDNYKDIMLEGFFGNKSQWETRTSGLVTKNLTLVDTLWDYLEKVNNLLDETTNSISDTVDEIIDNIGDVITQEAGNQGVHWDTKYYGKGQVLRLATERWSTIVNFTAAHRKTNFNGYVKLNESLYEFTGSKDDVWNCLHPAFKKHLDAFARQVMPIYKQLGYERIPMTSAFRTLAHNEELIRQGYQASRSSAHMAGIACDIGVPAKQTAAIRKICEEAKAYGFGGIATGAGFVHIDIGAQGRWQYNGATVNFECR